MLGNCATGKLRMVSEPTRTMTMEITMATMGRLMKNFDIGHLSLSCRGTCGGKRPGVHFRTWAHLLNSFHHDFFSSIQPAGDHPLGTDTVTDRDRPNAYLVVCVHNGDLVGALQLRDRALRNHQRVPLQVDDGTHLGVAARAQYVSRIRKQPGNPNGPGALVDLAVGKVERALVRVGGTIGQD